MRVLIVAGGTGGHILPAVTLANEIKLQTLGEVLFVASSGKQDKEILANKNINFTTLPIISLKSKGIFSILNFSTRLFIGVLASIFILLKFKPETLIGFGGYVSGPITLIGSIFGIKTIIHEQNVYPGLSNRILARFVTKIAISFEETKKYLRGFESKTIYSGIPLHQGLKRNGIEKPEDIFNILIIGGSQGAHILNILVPQAISLIDKTRRDTLSISHIAGRNEKEDVEKRYNEIRVKNRVFSFTDDMARLYNECDFVIARAGAMTVSELLALKIPAILVPYPYAGGHQALNAKVLEKIGSGIILEEKGLDPCMMRDGILKLMDRGILDEMAGKAKNVHKPDACEILIKELHI